MNNFIITVFISTCMLFFATTNFLMYPFKLLYKLSLFFILFILGYLKFQDGQSGTYTVLFFYFILIIFFSNNHSRFINFCTSILGYLCLTFLNQIALVLTEKLCNINYESLENQYGFLFSTIFSIFIYFFTFYIGKMMRKKLKLENLLVSKKTSCLILTSLLLCTYIFISNFVFGEKIGYTYMIIRQNAILFGSFFFITVALLYSIINTIRKEQDTRSKIEIYNGLRTYMSQLEVLYQETREFRHDYNNILYTLYGYIKERDIDTLETYYTNHILSNFSPFQNPTYELGKLSNIKILEIKSIVYIKMIQALTKGINLYINIPVSIKEVSLETLDLSQILGIFLDNAIEASIISSKKEIEFSFEKHINGYSIIIKNSCNENKILFTKLNSLGYSTKSENRGIGLYNAKKILARYPKIQHTTLLQNYYFIQKLENL